MHASVTEELSCGCGCEFWAAIRYEFIRNPVSHKDPSEAGHGALGFDGALRLHCWQLERRVDMSGVIPGQNTDVLALAVMDVTPW